MCFCSLNGKLIFKDFFFLCSFRAFWFNVKNCQENLLNIPLGSNAMWDTQQKSQKISELKKEKEKKERRTVERNSKTFFFLLRFCVHENHMELCHLTRKKRVSLSPKIGMLTFFIHWFEWLWVLNFLFVTWFTCERKFC